MWLESQLQSIQCGGRNFLLDISQSLFVLYLQDVYLYQQNLLECCSGRQTICLDFDFNQPRRDIPPQITILDSYDRTKPLHFPNTDSHDSVYLSSNYLVSSDWAPSPIFTQIYTIEPVTPTVLINTQLSNKGLVDKANQVAYFFFYILCSIIIILKIKQLN